MQLARALVGTVAAATALAAPALAQAAGSPAITGFENGVNIVLDRADATRTCLSIMSDDKNVELSDTCSANLANKVWYFRQDGTLGTRTRFLKDVSDNAGAVQVYEAQYNPDGAANGHFTFLAGSKIRNEHNQLCLSVGFYVASPPTQFLKYEDCSVAASWKLVAASIPLVAAVATPQVVQAPQIEQLPQIQPSSQALPQAPQVAQRPPQRQAHPATPQVAQGIRAGATGSNAIRVPPVTTKQVVQSRPGLPQESDHYLCICFVSQNNDDCLDAVKAACTVGHIPAEHCRASFELNSHDQISKHILEIIQDGAKCPSTDFEKLRNEASEAALPTHHFHGAQTVTSEDHYLCVCLASTGDVKQLDQQCADAVRVACMVGHIPEADCFASFDENNHARIANRIMEMIDSGANCVQHLQRSRTADCPNPPCYATNRHSKVARKEPHYLCVCLEDRQSVACKSAVEKACSAGAIPKRDCDVAEKADFHHAVTRHVMHLVDHGSECSIGGAGFLTFTNNRCHCKQEWTAPNGEVVRFPDNCRDPGGSRGYAWCETYAEEGCIGYGESMSWDRCDHPQRPRYHLGEFAQTSAGKVSPVDHYLCVCVDKAANDEACEAAAKAACMVGHLPSKACAESFQESSHSQISDAILEEIWQGARCNNMELALNTPHDSVDSRGVPIQSFTSGCGHGREVAGGACACQPGYAGLRCDYCAEGFIGYPQCVMKRDCDPACMYGSCDFTSGTCSCPANRKGTLCEECAWGYSGSECSPAGLLSSASGFGRLLFFGLVIGGFYALCCTALGASLIKSLSRRSNQYEAYSRLNQDVDLFDGDDSNILEVEPSSPGAGFSDTEFQPQAAASSTQPSKPAAPPRHASQHSGLAI